MSLSVLKEIKCRHCGGIQLTKIWSSVNILKDPDLKHSILNGELINYSCNICKQTNILEYDMLYHDMEKLFAIWLKYPDDHGYFGVDKNAASLFEIVGENYICRVVPSYEELLEKIKIIDCGLNDIEVELIKFIACTKEEIDIVQPMKFSGVKRSIFGIQLIVFDLLIGDKIVKKSYEYKNISKASTKIFQKLIKVQYVNDSWPHVDRNFVMEALSRIGLITEIR